MTREELTARLRKLTGKTADDIEALDERVDALEAGAGGGIEFNSLTVTVSYSGGPHEFTGFITSEIPETTVITNIIKMEHVDVSGAGLEGTTAYWPLPYLKGRINSEQNFSVTICEYYAKMDPVPVGMPMPLGLVFGKIDNTQNPEITATFKITYV